MRSSFRWQSPLAARGTVGCWPGWGGTWAWAPGTRGRRTGLDEMGLGCLCVFSAIKQMTGLKTPREQKHLFMLTDWTAAAISSCLLKLQITRVYLSSSLSKVEGFLNSVLRCFVGWTLYWSKGCGIHAAHDWPFVCSFEVCGINAKCQCKQVR